jgi:hypothetical protein
MTDIESSLQLLTSEVGSVHVLLGVEQGGFQGLVKDFLLPGFDARVAGLDTPDRISRKLVHRVARLGITSQVAASVETKDPSLRFIGLEMMRGINGGVQYRRPLPEDLPSGETREEYERLANYVQVQVPLLDGVSVRDGHSSSHVVEQGQYYVGPLVPRQVGEIAALHMVAIPTEAVNMELVFTNQSNPSSAWDEYLRLQPHPHAAA